MISVVIGESHVPISPFCFLMVVIFQCIFHICFF
uniref:Uncharacterized protein n=1 Tax=Rhizophora mucronata TaxID=61149 RepID=A0A2P2LTK7_RHIMU